MTRPGRDASARHNSSGVLSGSRSALASRHSLIAAAAILISLDLPHEVFSRGTVLPTIHSPSLSMKRVSWKLFNAPRTAAQLAGADRPTPVTIPHPVIASDMRPLISV